MSINAGSFWGAKIERRSRPLTPVSSGDEESGSPSKPLLPRETEFTPVVDSFANSLPKVRRFVPMPHPCNLGGADQRTSDFSRDSRAFKEQVSLFNYNCSVHRKRIYPSKPVGFKMSLRLMGSLKREMEREVNGEVEILSQIPFEGASFIPETEEKIGRFLLVRPVGQNYSDLNFEVDLGDYPYIDTEGKIGRYGNRRKEYANPPCKRTSYQNS